MRGASTKSVCPFQHFSIQPVATGRQSDSHFWIRTFGTSHSKLWMTHRYFVPTQGRCKQATYSSRWLPPERPPSILLRRCNYAAELSELTNTGFGLLELCTSIGDEVASPTGLVQNISLIKVGRPSSRMVFAVSSSVLESVPRPVSAKVELSGRTLLGARLSSLQSRLANGLVL